MSLTHYNSAAHHIPDCIGALKRPLPCDNSHIVSWRLIITIATRAIEVIHSQIALLPQSFLQIFTINTMRFLRRLAVLSRLSTFSSTVYASRRLISWNSLSIHVQTIGSCTTQAKTSQFTCKFRPNIPILPCTAHSRRQSTLPNTTQWPSPSTNERTQKR